MRLRRGTSPSSASCLLLLAQTAARCRAAHDFRLPFWTGETYVFTSCTGEVAEWSIVPDSKSGVPEKGTVGSNPTLSASFALKPRCPAAAFPYEGGRRLYRLGRLLADDPADLGFGVFRSDGTGGSSRKMNIELIKGSTNFVDREAGTGAKTMYSVKPIGVQAPAASNDPASPPISRVHHVSR